MFDYDARPATQQVVFVGYRTTSAGYQLRDFLSRNHVPYEWIDADDAMRMQGLFSPSDLTADRLPICILPDGAQLASATIEDVAAALGMVREPALSDYDLAIVGAGPAGLAAAVYAASEGLSVVAIEAVAPGGQAGTTSMIENYLGFSQGISGGELATRATAQAHRFGAEILLARPLVNISRDGEGYVARLSDHTAIRSRSLLIASGVEWRRLDVAGLDDMLGAGVYYGAGPSEAVTCRGCRVAVIGGGNSAGQAVVRFSRYASRVTLIVRASTIGASMSRYLAEQVTAIANVDVLTGTEVTAVDADTRLRALQLTSAARASGTLPVDVLFVCIGGVPRTEGLSRVGLATDAAGYLLTGPDLDTTAGGLDDWPLRRPPLPLETNHPGLFAAGDVRSGSIKRCAAAIGEGSMAVALVHRRLAEMGADR